MERVVQELLEVELGALMVVDMRFLIIGLDVVSVILYLGDLRQRPLIQLLQVSS